MYKIGLKNSYLLMKSLHVDFWHEWSSYNIKTICKNLSCELFIITALKGIWMQFWWYTNAPTYAGQFAGHVTLHTTQFVSIPK